MYNKVYLTIVFLHRIRIFIIMNLTIVSDKKRTTSVWGSVKNNVSFVISFFLFFL